MRSLYRLRVLRRSRNLNPLAILPVIQKAGQFAKAAEDHQADSSRGTIWKRSLAISAHNADDQRGYQSHRASMGASLSHLWSPRFAPRWNPQRSLRADSSPTLGAHQATYQTTHPRSTRQRQIRSADSTGRKRTTTSAPP